MNSQPCLGARPPHTGPPRFLRSFSQHAPSSPTPESRMTALACVFVTRAGFTHSGRLATLIFAFRGRYQVRSRYGSHRPPPEASTNRLLDSAARSATCLTGISHGEHLSAHKKDQAWPGAPEDAEGRRGENAEERRGGERNRRELSFRLIHRTDVTLSEVRFAAAQPADRIEFLSSAFLCDLCGEYRSSSIMGR